LRDNFRMNILVVAAHPDDEVLGCGGTIAKHAAAGDEVHILILAEGLTSRQPLREREKSAGGTGELAAAARKAGDILGVKSMQLHDFPDNRMDSLDRLDIVKKIEASVMQVAPQIVYTHWAGDVNIDHQIVHHAAVTACRPLPGTTVESILCFEVPSSTEWQAAGSAPPFVPNWFVDVSAALDAKLRALEAYRSEMRPWPHPRSIAAVTHLARWRGASVGVEAAEAFMLGRRILK
jgi:LmbE family N-acetylglucosaminyl deacetylase